MLLSCLHISHDVCKAQRTECLEFGSTRLVDASLLGTLIRCYWAASFGHFKDGVQLLWVVPASLEALPPCCERGEGQDRACTQCPAGLCWAGTFLWVHQQGSPESLRLEGLLPFLSHYLIHQCAWRSVLMVLVLSREVYPSKVLRVHRQGVAPQAAAEMTPGQTPVFGRKFRLLCWYLFLSF